VRNNGGGFSFNNNQNNKQMHLQRVKVSEMPLVNYQ